MGSRTRIAPFTISGETLRRYPNPPADLFRDAAAKLHGLTRDNIIAGNGSDDILTIATRCFIPPGGTLAVPEPTYSLYTVLARLEEAKPLPLPWEGDWSLPVEALAASGASAIYLANPNAHPYAVIDHTLNRVLDILEIELEQDLFTRWDGATSVVR